MIRRQITYRAESGWRGWLAWVLIAFGLVIYPLIGLAGPHPYSAAVQAQQRVLSILGSIARLYLWGLLPGGKRARFYSINVMRARHPAWFREDLERLFDLLRTNAIRPRVAQRIAFDEVADAHRRLEAGGLEGKLVLCPDLPLRSPSTGPP